MRHKPQCTGRKRDIDHTNIATKKRLFHKQFILTSLDCFGFWKQIEIPLVSHSALLHSVTSPLFLCHHLSVSVIAFVRLALKAQNSISFYCSLVKQRGRGCGSGRGNCISPTCDAWLPFGTAAGISNGSRGVWAVMFIRRQQAHHTKDVRSSTCRPKTNHKTIINPLPREHESKSNQIMSKTALRFQLGAAGQANRPTRQRSKGKLSKSW